MKFFAALAALLLIVAPANGQTETDADTTVAALMAEPVVQDAMARLEDMRETNNERLVAINEIPAPPFGEEPRAADIAERMRALGLDDVTIDEVGNVIGRRPGAPGGETIAIVAHLDTVFPEGTDVTVRREGNVFTAPGIGDNSRGLVALLALIDVLQAEEIETRDTLLFIGSVGEEGIGDLRGVRHLFRPGAEIVDAFIAIDGGDVERLVVNAVGSLRYRVTFAGPGGHSYAAFGMAHPHQALAEAIVRFTESATPITLDGDKATFSVGRIEGGTSVNSIPFESTMEVDMRSASPDKLNALHDAFLASMHDALAAENARRREGPELELSLTPIGYRPPGQNDPGQPLVQHAVAALRTFGIDAEMRESSTDANIPMSLGVPAITISRGGISRDAHSPDESWEDVDAHVALQATLLLILAEAELIGPTVH
ncbi:M20/M25/M40 family metallo-hydrolase [Hyphobacterium marinum]|uniref:M20/M25/M40 family metallo-hydrolase n=1 Tax=Hyphobacterium marinum TaxID=3116574 RepID=A0ABU7M1K1_9PROT|nr:M20/M25/M40 family metallo-hydrolase [Hyphobacterium sp. Y6023]MEE2567658.1 M20/M25/M40 family metallo-hydrolase [Hyphobacterium sp. Y6023]